MLYLHGIGHFHPEAVIDNKFLVDLDIGVDEEWILQRVGIRERRTVLDLEYIRTTRNIDVRGRKKQHATQMDKQAAAPRKWLSCERICGPRISAWLLLEGVLLRI